MVPSGLARASTTRMQLASILACPDCPPAIAARALVLSESFWIHLWYAALPFAATFGIVGWIVRRMGRDA